MAGRIEASRDLLLGLHALESRAIGREQLVEAVRAWTLSPDRSLSEVLGGLGGLDEGSLAELEGRAARDLGLPAGGPEPTATFDHDRPALGADRALAGGETEAGGGRFRVLRAHARGGLGEVFLAFDGELNRPVALKELQARRAHDPDSQDRFLREAVVTGKLEHPGIVPVYSLGRHPDGRPFYAMRFIEGQTLRDAIDRFHRSGARGPRADDRELAFRRLLGSVIDACNAVAYAHSRGVIHRDLKPENIMLGPFGETLVVDWGMAKSLGEPGESGSDPRPDEPADPSMTRPGSVLGTPRYMSPEQASGDLDRVGPPSDVYSLGAILYCLLVGHAPFPDGDVSSVLDRVRRGIFPAPRKSRKSVDPALEAICLKAMSTDPASRQPSALELAGDLEAWQADVRYRGEQELALGEARDALARLALERAHHALGLKDHHDEGMLWLGRALEHAPAEPPELSRLIRTSLGGWHAGAKLLERSFRHGGEIHAVAFCPEGRRLLTASGDHSARLWDVSTGSALSAPLKHEAPIRAVAFHPSGSYIATAGDDGSIGRWDAVTGEPLGDPLRHGVPIVSMAISPDGSRIAAVGGPGGFSLWDAETGSVLVESGKQGARALAVAFSPDGSTVAIALENGEVCLREAATGSPTGEPLAHGSAVNALAIDPTGRRLLAGTVAGEARLWDLDRKAPVVTIAHRGGVLLAEFRPGGESFATATGDGAARLWDSATGRPIGEPLARRERVDRLAFRPDGLMLATGSPDGTIRLWCAATALPIGPPLEPGAPGRSMAFSPDGRRIAAGGLKAVVRCWKVPEPVEGEVERIACWVRVTTDLEFDEGDAIRRMDGATSWELRRRLDGLGGNPPRC